MILATILPGAAMAEVCDKVRPLWGGPAPATLWDEFIGLAGTPVSLVLILASALAFRFRSQWGGLAVVVGWTLWVSMVAFYGGHDSIRQQAISEGCIGSPALFIGAVAAICIAMIIYTTPRQDRMS
ncbi:hypothetical protein Z945_413 [Sulfitobacter noctilucae]|nr:hypothetical protein Z945_413 [Sulfitobacter noctilucae]